MTHGYVEIEHVDCVFVTDNGACMCIIDGEKVYIPQFAIHDDSEVYARDTSGTLLVREDIAIEKELV